MNSLIEFVTNKYTCRYKSHNRCAHVFRWGTRVGMECGKISKYNDKLCHKHRYRYITSIEVIYKYLVYLFGMDMENVGIVIINDKNTIENTLYDNFNDQIYKNTKDMLKIHDDYKYFIEKYSSESCITYIEKLSALYTLLREYYKKEIIYKLYINVLYNLRKMDHFDDLLDYFLVSIIDVHLCSFKEEFNRICNYHFQRPIS